MLYTKWIHKFRLLLKNKDINYSFPNLSQSVVNGIIEKYSIGIYRIRDIFWTEMFGMWDSQAPINKRGFMIWLTFVKVHWDFFVHLSAILEEEWRVEQYCRQNQNGQGNIVQNRGQMGELTKRILCCKSYGVTITRVLKKQRYKCCNSCSRNVEYCVNMPFSALLNENIDGFHSVQQTANSWTATVNL